MPASDNFHQVIIIGSGFGGQCAALKMKEIGVNDFLILERRDFAGGTWCQNTYPGAAVDVQSPLYSIASEPYDWSQMFSEQEELKAYTNHVLDKHHLRDKICLNTDVKSMFWREDAKRWSLESENNEVFEARFVINASGPLSTPVVPDFNGKDSFEGESFHTNCWNHNYDYKNKRVAIIGSGASAAQVIPAIADEVKELHVFQRTPHWVLPRPDYIFRPWQRALLKHKWVYKLLRIIIYWVLESRVIAFKYSDFLLYHLAQAKAVRHIKRHVQSEGLRSKLTPNYTIGCKRIILSNTLYPAFCRDNVQLHTRDDAVLTVTEAGIKTTKGEEFDLDLIVYATGYDATDGVIPYPVTGKNNRTLADFWKGFPRAYLGTVVPNFPNFFIVTGPNTGIGHTSAVFVVEAQMEYIARAIQLVLKQSIFSIEATEDAESRYTKMIHREMKKTVWYKGNCRSWYQSKSGHVVAMFPGFSFTFRRWMKKLRLKDHRLS